VSADGTPGLALCVATNDEDTYTGTQTDEQSMVYLPVEGYHNFAWLDKTGYDRVIQPNGSSFRAIWEALRHPFQPYGCRDAGAQKKRLLRDPQDDAPPPPGGTTRRDKLPKVYAVDSDDESVEYRADLPAHLVGVRMARKRPLQTKGLDGYTTTRKYMYIVPPGMLRAPPNAASAQMDITQGKANASGSKTILQKLATGNLPVLLRILSAGETRDVLSEDISDATTRVIKQKAVPVDPYTIQQLLKSWLIPDGYNGLERFVSLLTVLGPAPCKVRVQRYRQWVGGYNGEAVGKHSPEYLAYFAEGLESSYLNGEIVRVGDALMNLISAITVLFSMRFCYQHVMFQSVLTLIEYFKIRDFGQQSEVMLPFMRACVASMMTAWDELRSDVCNYRHADDKETKAALLARGRAIPNLEKHGLIEKLYEHFLPGE